MKHTNQSLTAIDNNDKSVILWLSFSYVLLKSRTFNGNGESGSSSTNVFDAHAFPGNTKIKYTD
jgi:hypothetical protein